MLTTNIMWGDMFMKHQMLAAALLALTTPLLHAQTTSEREIQREIRIVEGLGRSFLGVAVDEVTAQTAGDLRLAEEYGALIQSVVDNSGAKAAGLQLNDVVVGWNGTRVESARALRRMILESPIGRRVTLTIVRNGQQMQVSAAIGARSFSLGIPETPDVPRAHEMVELQTIDSMEWTVTRGDGPHKVWSPCVGTDNGPRIGVMVTTTVIHARHPHAETDEAQSVITEVFADMPAQDAGLLAGDVITSVNGTRVNAAEGVRELIHEFGRDTNVTHVTIGYARNGVASSVDVRLDRTPRVRDCGERVLPFKHIDTPEVTAPATPPPSILQERNGSPGISFGRRDGVGAVTPAPYAPSPLATVDVPDMTL